MSEPVKYDADLMARVAALGFEVVKDTDTDYYLFAARHWVEDSGLYDTPEEAARACIEAHE